MYVRHIFLLLVLFSCTRMMQAQELFCTVDINDQKLNPQERIIMKQMKIDIEQFMNQTRWTDDVYQQHERINCSFLITITEEPQTIGSYKAVTQVRVLRPVYGTTYSTVLFNFLDNYWEFEYVQNQQMNFNENQFLSNLTSMLAFYAYYIIGLDHDSFGKLGGTLFFERALIIQTNGAQSGYSGWQQMENNRNNNRYWLMENVTNSQISPFREAMYTYHRLALDNFQQKPEESRTLMINVFKEIKKVMQIRPVTVILNSFLDFKHLEFMGCFAEASPPQKQEAVQILAEIDPPKSEKYQGLLRN